MNIKQANTLLDRAHDAFLDADWHPYSGIESEIRQAQQSKLLVVKLYLLRRLPRMLVNSDWQSVRNLAREIAGAVDEHDFHVDMFAYCGDFPASKPAPWYCRAWRLARKIFWD